MEETTYGRHQQREHNHKLHQPRVATIFRSRSCRDREVLSEYHSNYAHINS